MIKSDLNIDQQRCPLCGEQNDCAKVDDPTAYTDCWCQAADVCFPTELTEQVPGPLRNKACICQKCANDFKV